MIKRFSAFLESAKKFPNIQKKEINGFEVLIGKDAQSNDHLTFNIARKEDLWFHVSGVPGSHVVLRISGSLPDERTILEVAKIAAKNSKCKDESCKVVYCKANFVTKDSGMNVGQVKVDYKNSEKIEIKNN